MRGADPNCTRCKGSGMVSPFDGSVLDGAPDWMAVPCKCRESHDARAAKGRVDVPPEISPAWDWLAWLVKGMTVFCVVAAVVVCISILLFLAESNGWSEWSL